MLLVQHIALLLLARVALNGLQTLTPNEKIMQEMEEMCVQSPTMALLLSMFFKIPPNEEMRDSLPVGTKICVSKKSLVKIILLTSFGFHSPRKSIDDGVQQTHLHNERNNKK